MIKSSKFFLFYFLSLFVGSLSTTDFETVRKNWNTYSWMVIINHVSEFTDLQNYGTIIHERAILTLANPIFNKSGKLKFQVWSDLDMDGIRAFSFNTGGMSEDFPPIKEYHLIEYGSPGNLAILILTEPLHLSDTANTVTLYRENDQFDPNNCILLSLYHDVIPNGQGTLVTYAPYFIPFDVKLNKTHPDLVTLLNDTWILNDKQRNLIQKNEVKFPGGLKFFGGPLYCKSKDTEKWSQLGVTDLVIKKQEKDHSKLIVKGNIIRIDNNTLHSVINEVLKTSNIFNWMKVHTNIKQIN